MNQRRRLVLVPSIVAACLTALAAGAQTTANGPYYATPSWDQTLPASTRFVVLANFSTEAALDRETGLVWQRSLLAPTDLNTAQGTCASSTAGAKLGWRLPTAAELGSLFDPTKRTPPFLPDGHPFLSIPSEQYPNGPFIFEIWSSTPALGTIGLTLTVGYFNNQFASRPASFAESNAAGIASVLCVRAPS